MVRWQEADHHIQQRMQFCAVSENRISEIWISEVWISENFGISEFRNFGISEFRNFGISEFRNFDISAFRKVENVDFWTLGAGTLEGGLISDLS